MLAILQGHAAISIVSAATIHVFIKWPGVVGVGAFSMTQGKIFPVSSQDTGAMDLRPDVLGKKWENTLNNSKDRTIIKIKNKHMWA